MTTHNIEAEQAVLGACMSMSEYGPIDSFDVAAGILGPGDFYAPRHATIWEGIAALRAESVAANPILLAEQLARMGAKLSSVGGAEYLITCLGRAVPRLAVPHHAQIIADHATRRRIEQAGQSIAQRGADPGVDPAELVAWSADLVAGARDERRGVEILTRSYDDFFNETPDNRTMVLPGLLGEGDRVILTGHGGLGKSTMLRQIAVTAAAGLPAFDYARDDPFDPVKVDIIDLENPDHRTKSRVWPMVQECLKLGVDPRPNLRFGGRGRSFDLLNPQDALSLLRTIEHDTPQLLLIGPVYKMHHADPNSEETVRGITTVLDHIRDMNVCILMEAHHTKEGKKGGTLEPSGHNSWTWWPEFGLGLRLSGDDDLLRPCTLERWRIDREESQWPDEVQSSGQTGLQWDRAAPSGFTPPEPREPPSGW